MKSGATVPSHIGGAKVICYTPVDHRHKFTGNGKQTRGGRQMGTPAGLAICQYDQEDAFYLFGCDSDWNSHADTWHETEEDAKYQAESEYKGTWGTWIYA